MPTNKKNCVLVKEVEDLQEKLGLFPVSSPGVYYQKNILFDMLLMFVYTVFIISTNIQLIPKHRRHSSPKLLNMFFYICQVNFMIIYVQNAFCCKLTLSSNRSLDL